jgi:hypothetical protein
MRVSVLHKLKSAQKTYMASVGQCVERRKERVLVLDGSVVSFADFLRSLCQAADNSRQRC